MKLSGIVFSHIYTSVTEGNTLLVSISSVGSWEQRIEPEAQLKVVKKKSKIMKLNSCHISKLQHIIQM